MDKDAVNEWLAKYIAAWKSYDRDEIMALFTEDAEYRYHPYDAEPVRGNDAIAASWVTEEAIDEPDTYEANYEAYVVGANGTAVATGESVYSTREGGYLTAYDNCFVMRFAADGRCSSFTEWFMERPK